MNIQNRPWTIEIVNLETNLSVGIWEHEVTPQPILVSLSLRAIAPAFPQTIEDCINYQPVCAWITTLWPEQQHTPLLETKLFELMNFVFAFDSRIEFADISISKTKAIPAAQKVGVRMALSRSEYEFLMRRREECS